MIFENMMTDAGILREIGNRIAQSRINANLTQQALSREAGVSKRTLERLEAGHSIQLNGFIRILRVLNLIPNLDTLIADPGPRPMDLLKLKGKTRRRASSPRHPASERRPWTWIDPS